MNLGLIPSLFLFYGVLSILYAAALHYYLKIKDQQAVAYWSLGSLIWGCAVLLTMFRQEVPLLLSYFLANAVAFFAYVEMNRALRVLVPSQSSRPPKRWHDMGLILAYTGVLYAIAQWTPDEYSELAKTGFVSAVLVIVAFQGASFCRQIGRGAQLRIAHNFGYLYMAVGALWLARILAAAAFQTTHAFDPAPINAVIWVLMFITGIVKYMVFPMLLLQKAENEEQARMRSKLIKANKSVTSGALSAAIAHELNQPLTAMHLNGEILRRTMNAQSDPQHKQPLMQTIVEEILADNERAAKIIASLRAIFSLRPSATNEIDTALLIQQSMALVEKERHSTQVHIELQLAEHLPVQVPEEEFHQVLLNLLLNSIQALQQTAPGYEKRIAIQTQRVAGEVEIAVSDNGPGVPAEMQEQLFNILNSSKDTGLGVGLWLCKFIIERHGGRISYGPGKLGGATFIISLPSLRPQP